VIKIKTVSSELIIFIIDIKRYIYIFKMNVIQYPVKAVADFFENYNLPSLYTENNGIKLNSYAVKEYSIYTCFPLAFLFVVFRYGFQKVFSQTRFLTKYGSDIPKKFSESLYKLLYYSLTFYAICYILVKEESIWPDIENCWNYVLEGQTRSLIVSGYYMFELSFYVSELICISWLETKRKDRTVLLVHHIATITLLSISYVYGFHRIGILVLYAHNINDIFLEAAKICKYAGFDDLANVNFVFLILSWIASRLYFFPFHIIRSTYYDTYEIVFKNTQYLPQYYIANGCLIVLFFMHLYWFFLICRIAYNALKNGKTEDERENIKEV
jgi:ceramide synthetase